MLKRYAAHINLIRAVIDLVIVALAWLAVYQIRFHSGLLATPRGIPDYSIHLSLMLPVVLICILVFILAGLYQTMRLHNLFSQFIIILKASVLAGLLVLGFFYYRNTTPYSRVLVALFIFLLFIGLIMSHLFIMLLMRTLRKHGYNQRHYVVIGAGKRGQQLVEDIERNVWMGLTCAFFVDDDPDLIDTTIRGISVYGPVDQLPRLMETRSVDEVFLASTGEQAQRAYPILQEIQNSGVSIRILPDWGTLATTSGATATTIGTQILYSAADSPLSSTSVLIKNLFDRIVALILLIIFLVPMVIIAILVKLTSKGPVFFTQTRVGMDARNFTILKFRSMYADHPAETQLQWTSANDARCTSLGRWLRRSSMDELPQLFNVLLGQMSLVGPRPERPELVKTFSADYKKYMMRHKVKGGITGWAQIHGQRGDTSLRKRLLYDLYYARNWSFWFDIYILLRTPLHVLRGKNAY